MCYPLATGARTTIRFRESSRDTVHVSVWSKPRLWPASTVEVAPYPACSVPVIFVITAIDACLAILVCILPRIIVLSVSVVVVVVEEGE